jgi:hypothetical protein
MKIQFFENSNFAQAGTYKTIKIHFNLWNITIQAIQKNIYERPFSCIIKYSSKKQIL